MARKFRNPEEKKATIDSLERINRQSKNVYRGRGKPQHGYHLISGRPCQVRIDKEWVDGTMHSTDHAQDEPYCVQVGDELVRATLTDVRAPQ